MLDLLWYKYWVATLSASPLISNREFAAGQVIGWWERDHGFGKYCCRSMIY